jgi:hypothetical protein
LGCSPYLLNIVGAGLEELVQFVKELSLTRGHAIIECGTMVPRDWILPTKEFVRDWYLRSGYCEVRTPFEDSFPQFKELLITRCDVIEFRKDLV